jgi:SAM-dependent methyltransferase
MIHYPAQTFTKLLKMQINSYPIVRGLASYVLPDRILKRPGSGGSISSEYCYSVWLRHLYYLMDKKLFAEPGEIRSIAEIGPGDSLGIGLSALYTGASRYYAFDVIEHTSLDRNLQINEELFDFFRQQAPIPNTERQKSTRPELPNYDFPSRHLPSDEKYYNGRREAIQKALTKEAHASLSIKYVVPWYDVPNDDVSDLDLIFSQAVMEHVDNIEFAYGQMYRWLRKGGVISHEVDFQTHEMTKEWNGHFFIGDSMWSLLSRGRKYPMNRLPLSAHISMIEKAGFTIKNVVPDQRQNSFKGQQPKVPGVTFSKGDLETCSALIQAVK